jgi:hypothetical protein
MREKYGWDDHRRDAFAHCISFRCGFFPIKKGGDSMLSRAILKLCDFVGQAERPCALAHLVYRKGIMTNHPIAHLLSHLFTEMEANSIFVLESGEMGMGVGSFREGDQLVTVPGLSR